ncbi:hypothetical protein CHS0354_025496 [Potamilus streckersoni]|uniref:Uncharacterized protein n=1 Tax=Potamilus streckersoni TaxID=2493646 RepID=A0AAE0T5Y6_9BIVA|nr:hypothetical protein CHS0354_025496 [Potamilus streckersoni]
MHGSQMLRILLSLTFMSHLYKELSCESIFHKTEDGLEQKIAEKHLPEITGYMEQERLKQQRPFHEVLNRARPYIHTLGHYLYTIYTPPLHEKVKPLMQLVTQWVSLSSNDLPHGHSASLNPGSLTIV